MDALVRRVAAREAGAFEQLYARTSTRLFAICRQLLGEAAEAEDALQDTFLTVWRVAASFDPARGSTTAWLTMLAHNRAVDRLRRRSRVARLGTETRRTELPEDPLSQLEALLAEEQDRQLMICLDTLDPRDLSLIRTAFFEGISYSKLADRESTPLPTVKSRIRRALLKLRTCLA